MTELTPIRRGRCAGAGNWQTQYQALQMTAREAAELIRDGDTAAFAAMSNWPWELDGALAERLLETGGHIAIYGHFIPAGTRLLTPELAGQVTYDSNFYGVERGLEPMGNVHYAPSNLSQTPAWLLARRPRVAALTCSLPDENGWMSRSLWGTALSRKVLEQCELVLAEVNPRMPNIPSDGEAHTRIHVSEVDGIIESSRPLVETPIAAGNETDSRIAGYIADLVPDGACIQLGLGGLANTVGECLAHAGKRDLGVHTEILSTGVMELMRRGVVNNSRKQTCPGRSVYANMVGRPELWAFAHENPAFCQKEIDWVNDARNIARNDHVVSINNAMEIDLTGQVNAESIGPRQWSKGGKSILALRSSYRDKAGVLHSKIVPQLAPGSVVTTPRTCVQYVVTEYGVADLKYKSTVERARALIAIAHPDFRRGFTVVRYWETTDWSVRPRSSTSRRARRRIRSSASVSTKILMSNISRRVGFWKIRMPSTMMTLAGWISTVWSVRLCSTKE